MRDRDRTQQRRPIVIAHRGASGYRPEHTLASYELAIELGADFIEPDLVVTSDGHLIARHENELCGTTDVADHPEFASRRTTKMIDGVSATGWFAEDFTLAEIKRLRARERIPGIRPDNARYDGRFEIPSLREIIRLVRDAERRGRRVGIYPETKHPTYFQWEGCHLDGTPIGVSLGRLLVDTLVAERFTDPARVFIQSFEIENLIELHDVIMPGRRVDLPLVQLYGDFGRRPVPRPYDMAYNASHGRDLRAIYGGLAALVPGGISPATGYDALTGRDVLRYLAQGYAEAIAPSKESLVLRASSGAPSRGSVAAGTGVSAESFVADAIDAGLQVHPYTLRAEPRFVARAAEGRPQTVVDEAMQLLRLGAHGFFIDHPDLGVEARDLFVRTDPRNGPRNEC